MPVSSLFHVKRILVKRNTDILVSILVAYNGINTNINYLRGQLSMSIVQTLRGFATISYWADDMEAAKEWYSELLGISPYFERSGPDVKLAYAEYRLGDYQHELGLIDRRFAPAVATGGIGGAVMYWHVDDIEVTIKNLKALSAEEYEPLIHRGETGFITASFIDPFGNILGIMYNPHYLEILNTRKGDQNNDNR